MTTESNYPISFREDDAKQLGLQLVQHGSVVVVGMKRVGISNFLRFFLSHPQIQTKYLAETKFLFIPVDLNDLVEREIYPFWVLLLKRLIDSLDNSSLPEESKKQARKLFTESIQLKDLFFTVDCVRQIITLIAEQGFSPVLFLLRFDRLKDAVTPEFFGNLQSLKEAGKQRLSFVFTSFRALHHLAPPVFTKQSLSVFVANQFIRPATDDDMKIILGTFAEQYQLIVKVEMAQHLLKIAGGHVHYLQLMLLRLKQKSDVPSDFKSLLEYFAKDEEINLQSEELFANLTRVEQAVLLKLIKKEPVPDEERTQAQYLWNTGIVTDSMTLVFSPLFAQYLSSLDSHQNGTADFTKKEHRLFAFLHENEGQLCERENLINAVWPEQAESGVSDWAVDRLVARVRSKLKKQQSPFEIITVITRGYKLVKKL